MLNTAYDIEKAFKAIEDELIASMMRNLASHRAEETDMGFNWSQWQVEQLKALEKYKTQNKKKFTKSFSNINDSIDAMIFAARQEGGTEQEQKILRALKKGLKASKVSQGAEGAFFRLNTRKLEALIKATKNDFGTAEKAMLRMSEDKYRQIIFNAEVYAATGAGTYEKAVDMATKDFLKAGINCIEYSNGARHSMKSYAKMAIQTACKRAYLTGEGEMRQSWGISTVIMNKRANACPKCLPFVGKILIDDVWSGGKASDGPYPLMSSAMAAGLYHPNCKDVHTTYFPELDDEPDSKFSKKELEQVKKDYRQDQKQQYAGRMVEQFDRLSKYSIDPDNKKVYTARKEQWENVVANGQKNDIMESDLSTFKCKLRNDSDIEKEYYNILKEKFSHGNKAAKHLFAKYAGGETIDVSMYEGTAHFNTKTKKISMHYKADMSNIRGAGTTWYHEHGHLIDDSLGMVSRDEHFKELLEQDTFQYRIKYGKEHNLKTYDKVDRAISNDLQDIRRHSAVSDLLDGLTKGNIKGCAGHSIDYWDNQENIASEAFAHMFEAQFDEVHYKEMQKYFPKSLEYFEKKLKEVAR
ncbi:phage minor capsid protein [Lachnospira eligens]|uniref:Minor capsid protein n=2 Tax=Lachnospira TaxID=28050 RepID=A0A413YU28_9FIRM|nr:phage minor capsid protein [Lachnospira eligens]RHC12581.1 minor capsid protein [Lachnospira eligens]